MWSNTEPKRIGVVSYLNARPLYEFLPVHAPGIELVSDVPSQLADRLREGALDLALIPSIEYFRGAHLGYRIVPGLAIAAHGSVRSVKLFSRVPLDRIERLALDVGSRTSQALTRVWLHTEHGVIPPVIESHPLGIPVQESLADAVLLIGDRAMNVPEDNFHTVVDLAEAWNQMTGLPFVFAIWVTRTGVSLGTMADALVRSCRDGLEAARDLAQTYGPRLGLDADSCYEYLTRVLSYELGEAEVEGLRRFAQMSAALGLVPKGVCLEFLDLDCPRDLAARH